MFLVNVTICLQNYMVHNSEDHNVYSIAYFYIMLLGALAKISNITY
jgi:hypothetical protein